jgi:hypothetical protein
MVCFVLFSFVDYSVVKGLGVIPTLIAGKLESRYLSTIMFFKERERLFDSVSVVTYYPGCAKVFHCSTWNTG